MSMTFPDNLFYTEDHEWIRTESDLAYVGITAFAQKELGDIVFVEIEGKTRKQYDVFGTIKAVKTVSDLCLPLSGEILEINPKIISNPELVNKDPYGEGWLIKLKISNAEEISSLLYSAEYQLKVGTGKHTN